MSNEQVSIYVASHKKINVELPEGYLICQVNTAKNGKWEGNYVYDNASVDNISLKNDCYCELTALYELWKNNESDIKGLAHYRRFFAERDSLTFGHYLGEFVNYRRLKTKVLRKNTIIQHLKTHDIIVEYPRNPNVVNAYEDLIRFVYPENIKVLSDIIHLSYPEYEESYYRVLRSTHISYFNMFITRSEILDSYCTWLFDVLFKLEKRIDIEKYDEQHKRIFGYIGEVLLNVWILMHRLNIKYVFCVSTVQVQGSENRKRIKSHGYNSIVLLLYLKIFKKKIFNDYKKRFISFHLTCCEKPYIQTLDDIYCKVKSVDDVLKYYSKYHDAVLSKERVPMSGSNDYYACVKFEYGDDYKYLQSNNRCIVSFFENDANVIHEMRELIRDRYEDKYTINFRVVTENPEIICYSAKNPEIYTIMIS